MDEVVEKRRFYANTISVSFKQADVPYAHALLINSAATVMDPSLTVNDTEHLPVR